MISLGNISYALVIKAVAFLEINEDGVLAIGKVLQLVIRDRGQEGLEDIHLRGHIDEYCRFG